MRTHFAFTTIGAMALGLMAQAAMAKDIDPPKVGTLCDTASKKFIVNNGGKGLRISVKPAFGSDGELYFNLTPERRTEFVKLNQAFGGLPPMTVQNLGIPKDMVKQFGAESSILFTAKFAEEEGSWATVVAAKGGGYGVQVFVSLGNDGKGCLTAYAKPEIIAKENVSAALLK